MLRLAIDARDAVAPDQRGWQRYTAELLRALRRVADLDVLALERGWPGPELAWEMAGFPLAARGCDVMHAPNCFLPPRRPCPGVVTIHDLAFEEFPEDFTPRTRAKFKWVTPRAARSAEAVIVPSSFTRDDVLRRYRVDPGKVHVIGEAPALPRGEETPPEGPYILGVGDLRAKKNWGRLVEAWVALRREGLPHRLVIAGGDLGEGPALRAAAGDEPLELPGYVPDGRLDALMRGADVLVHPSLYEGFGLVLLEALVRGTPVAAARATALPETGGEACEYFDPLDAADMAGAIRRALGATPPAPEASWDRTAAQTVEVYRSVAR